MPRLWASHSVVRTCANSLCCYLCTVSLNSRVLYTHTRLTVLFLGLPRWAGSRKVKPIWILLKQETVSGSGISWAICKSAPCCRQTTTLAPHHSYRPDALCATQPTASKHWRQSHVLYLLTKWLLQPIKAEVGDTVVQWQYTRNWSRVRWPRGQTESTGGSNDTEVRRQWLKASCRHNDVPESVAASSL